MSATTRSEVVVIGAGGHSKVVISTLLASGLRVVAVLDDDPLKTGGEILGVPVLAGLDGYLREHDFPVILAIGDNLARRDVVRRFARVEWATVVHPSAYVHPSVTLGPGTVVFAGAVIQPDSKVGAHAIINTGATVDHDCELGNFVHLAPGVHLAGNVSIGEGALLGIGSVVKPGLQLGSWTTVGAGAVVVSDLAANITAVGVPARPRAGARP